MRRYNYYGPLEVDKDGLERMAKALGELYGKVIDRGYVWEVPSYREGDCMRLIKAYHGITE